MSRQGYMKNTVVLKISGVPKELKEMLENISINQCEDLSKVLRPVLKQFVDSQPERMKRKPMGY